MKERDIVRVGNARGKIALYLDEHEAHDLAAMFHYSDLGRRELLDAIDRAYPQPSEDDEPRPGISIVVRDRRAGGDMSTTDQGEK